MKRISLILCAAFVVLCAFASLDHFKASITGSIEPAEGAKKVWAVSGTDTLSVIPMSGKFAIEVKPGNWKLVVEAVPPYKNAMVDNIQVQEGQSTDAGVIRLSE